MDRSESRSAEVHRAAAILAAMGDPIRLTIVMALASEELRVRDLCDIFGGSQANVSGHLKRLVAVGLVAGRRAGREIHYRVAGPRVQVVVATVAAMARAASDKDPEEARASSPTPIRDLLREHSHTITLSRKALDVIQLRTQRRSVPARRRSRPRRQG
ncbi:MAG TPA: metalloregulator ArsR/SmtB family transcription factor [Candidatus Micrarchaeaceae archaeon]|nr:metalloregulator ArsR/SmtB family transcription factor [Candidatus Micrarchaeaceae archaeon]